MIVYTIDDGSIRRAGRFFEEDMRSETLVVIKLQNDFTKSIGRSATKKRSCDPVHRGAYLLDQRNKQII